MLHSWVAAIFQAVSTALVGETTKTCHDLVELVGGGKALSRLAIIQTNFTLSTMSRFSVLVTTNVGRRMIVCVLFVQDAWTWQQFLCGADIVPIGPTPIVGVVSAGSGLGRLAATSHGDGSVRELNGTYSTLGKPIICRKRANRREEIVLNLAVVNQIPSDPCRAVTSCWLAVALPVALTTWSVVIGGKTTLTVNTHRGQSESGVVLTTSPFWTGCAGIWGASTVGGYIAARSAVHNSTTQESLVEIPGLGLVWNALGGSILAKIPHSGGVCLRLAVPFEHVVVIVLA